MNILTINDFFCGAGGFGLGFIQEGFQVSAAYDFDKYGKLIVRRLTPREHAKLQGFPESYTLEVSDAQLYKQFGNAVSVPIVKSIAHSVREILQSL